jgi:adenylate kinase
MRLILVGAPGSGKGTQAQLLSERLGLAHIGTGDILRDAVSRATPAGKQAEPYVKCGQLVPDDLVNELVADRFRRDDRPDRFILDGYPRTVAQAAALDSVLRQQFLDLDAVLHLVVDDEEIIRRLQIRNRADDQEETVRQRLKSYHQSTMELIPYYRRHGLLREVVGEGDIETIYQTILTALKSQAGPRC